jgi:predicted TIM-barrel fold metal-dependent hydrolase
VNPLEGAAALEQVEHASQDLGSVGPTRLSACSVDDIEIAGMFPQVNFEVLHPGFAFVEETAWLFARYPNVYVNLEWTASCSPPRGASQRCSAT